MEINADKPIITVNWWIMLLTAVRLLIDSSAVQVIWAQVIKPVFHVASIDFTKSLLLVILMYTVPLIANYNNTPNTRSKNELSDCLNVTVEHTWMVIIYLLIICAVSLISHL